MNWSLSFVPLMCAAGIVAIAFNGGLIGGHGACSDVEIYRFGACCTLVSFKRMTGIRISDGTDN
ncbi:hypothetical protein J6187_003825 [Salmonella enterica]|nr:hypothetical protein [Salmonella enterica]EHG9741847.1 hypothetical protein [Salmonella enterica]